MERTARSGKGKKATWKEEEMRKERTESKDETKLKGGKEKACERNGREKKINKTGRKKT